jgi:hypothetical protein
MILIPSGAMARVGLRVAQDGLLEYGSESDWRHLCSEIRREEAKTEWLMIAGVNAKIRELYHDSSAQFTQLRDGGWEGD